jgi:preprotein translocase subunit SecY
MILGCVVFSIFWVNTAGMDSKSVAKQIQRIGLGIPGFRRDIRIIERVLDRYIPYLAVLSGLMIGLLAAFADFAGALGTGTGILLTVMIVYNLYEEIAMQHLEDVHPALRRFLR